MKSNPKGTPLPDTTESVTIPADNVTRVPIHEWTVEVAGGPDKGRHASALSGLIRVGTDESNDLVLSDGTVSRRHLEIERTPRGLLLRDLNSRNGTFVDGRPVLQAFVQPGDKIDLGKTKLTLRQKSRSTDVELDIGDQLGELVGESESMRIIFAEIRRVTREDLTLLIEGETGTGKELAARAVHAYSSRRFGPFRVVDCPSLNEQNLERELFGAEGALATARGGVVFFDEVADLPPAAQARLLRILEAKEWAPGKKLDGRVIAATARNLSSEVEQKRFRQELYFRLAVVRVRMPPLRTRKVDIPILAKHLVKSLAAPIDLSAQMLSLLEGYDWPGNVRELRNVLERGALMQATGNSSWLDLLVQPEKRAERSTLLEVASKLSYHEAKDRVQNDFERHYFAEVMKHCGYDLKLAEQHTGLSTQSLYRLLKKSGLRLKALKNADSLG
jgi:two-component system response regulator GlrR